MGIQGGVPEMIISRSKPRSSGDLTRSMLRVDGLSKRFGDYHALADVRFDIREGEITGVIGPRASPFRAGPRPPGNAA